MCWLSLGPESEDLWTQKIPAQLLPAGVVTTCKGVPGQGQRLPGDSDKSSHLTGRKQHGVEVWKHGFQYRPLCTSLRTLIASVFSSIKRGWK